MKLVYISLLIFILGFVQSNDEQVQHLQFYPEENQLYKETWNNIVLKAVKRKYPGYTRNKADKCCTDCQRSPPFPYAFWDFEKNYATTEYAQRVCNYYNTSSSCIQNCPESARKQFLTEISAPIKYLCQESLDLIDNIDCLAKSTLENMGNCESHCNIYQKWPTNSSLTPKEDAEIRLNIGCKMLKCILNCTDSFRQENCGVSANGEMQKFVGKIVNNFNDLRYLYFMSYLSVHDFIIDIPANCKPCKIVTDWFKNTY